MEIIFMSLSTDHKWINLFVVGIFCCALGHLYAQQNCTTETKHLLEVAMFLQLALYGILRNKYNGTD